MFAPPVPTLSDFAVPLILTAFVIAVILALVWAFTHPEPNVRRKSARATIFGLLEAY